VRAGSERVSPQSDRVRHARHCDERLNAVATALCAVLNL
jgi:hypothetical protein